MKKILITGSEGFLGSHLAKLLSKKNQVYCLYKKDSFLFKHKKNKYLKVNINDKKKIENIIKKIKPDVIFHLAAKSHPVYSFKFPVETLKTNVIGTINLLDAVKKFSINSKIIVACSSAQYGKELMNKHKKVKEDLNYNPDHIYGLSKYFQNRLSNQYFKMHKLRILNAIIFNTSGPGKVGDVFYDFIKRFIKGYKKNKKILTFDVGNILNKRDFLHYKDTVNALLVISNKGKIGQSYNISTSKLSSIKDILNYLAKKFSVKLIIKKDKKLIRKFDEKIIAGNNKKLKQLGWRPKKNLQNIIDDMCEFYLKKNK